MNDTVNGVQRRFKAFISYSSRDAASAKWLHRAIESYRVPKPVTEKLRSEGRDAKLYPIFRDREEFAASHDLTGAIASALDRSEFLIVVCSPHSAKSRWVNEEIRRFRNSGREQNVLTVIVGGDPLAGADSDQNCFPPALAEKTPAPVETHQKVTLAADARPEGDGRDSARLKVISGLLGVDFGTLRDRELASTKRRTRIARIIAGSMAALAVLATCAAIIARLTTQVAEERLGGMQRAQTLAAMEKAHGLKPPVAASLLLEVLPSNLDAPDRPLVPEALALLSTTYDMFPDVFQIGGEPGQQLKLMATASDSDRVGILLVPSNRLLVYDIEQGIPKALPPIQLPDEAMDLSFSADGTHVAIAYRSQPPALIDMASRASEPFVVAEEDPTHNVALSPSSRKVAICDGYGRLSIISTSDRQTLTSIELGSIWSPRLMMASEDSLLIETTSPDEIASFDVSTGRENWRAPRKGRFRFVADGALHFDGGNPVVALSLRDGKPTDGLTVPGSTDSVIGLSHDGARVLTTNGLGKFDIRNRADGSLLRSETIMQNSMSSQALLATGSGFLAATAGEPFATFVPARSSTQDMTGDLANAKLVNASFSGDGAHIWLMTSDGTVQSRATANLNEHRKWQFSGTPLSVFAGRADGAIAMTDQSIYALTASSDKPTNVFTPAGTKIVTATASAANNSAVAYLSDGTLILWNARDGSTITLAKDEVGFLGSETLRLLTGLWIAPDESRVAFYYQGSVAFYDTKSGKPTGTSQMFDASASPPVQPTASFSRDGTMLAVALGQMGLRAIDASNGNEVSKIDDTTVNGAQFSPDGRWLLLSTTSGAISLTNFPLLLDVSSGQMAGPLKTFGPPIGAPAASGNVTWIGQDRILGMLDAGTGVQPGGTNDRLLTIWDAISRFPVHRVKAEANQNSYGALRFFASPSTMEALVSTPEDQLLFIKPTAFEGQELVDHVCSSVPGIDDASRLWLGVSNETPSSAQQWLTWLRDKIGLRTLGERRTCGTPAMSGQTN